MTDYCTLITNCDAMLTCPMCKKTLRAMTRECPACRTDLSLLVDYAGSIQDGLARAESLTRAGYLGEAVWAYLAILEVDPDCPAARRQVGQVAAAVRQFDQITDGRRWYQRVRDNARFGGETGWLNTALWVALVLGALLIGYWIGHRHESVEDNSAPASAADSRPTKDTPPD
jgi:uncharacterized protein YbaR (Trm112 family)